MPARKSKPKARKPTRKSPKKSRSRSKSKKRSSSKKKTKKRSTSKSKSKAKKAKAPRKKKSSGLAPKIKKGEKKALVVGIGARLRKAGFKGVNKMKADMSDALLEEKARGKQRHIRLNQTAQAEMKRALSDHISKNNKKADAHQIVDKACHEFSRILLSPPKRLLSAYMTFGMTLQKKLKGKDIKERSQHISSEWDSLSEKKQQSFGPSKKKQSEYKAKQKKFQHAVKKFKA